MAVCNLDRKNAAFGEIPQDREITQSLTALLGQMEKEANATKDNSAKTIRQYFAITKEWLGKIFARKKDIGKGHVQFYNKFEELYIKKVPNYEFAPDGKYYNYTNDLNNYRYDNQAFDFQLAVFGVRNGKEEMVGSFNVPDKNTTMSYQLHKFVEDNNMPNTIPINKDVLMAITAMRPATFYKGDASFNLSSLLNQYGADYEYMFSDVFILTETIGTNLRKEDIGRPFVFYSQYGNDVPINEMVKYNSADLKMLFLDTDYSVKDIQSLKALYNKYKDEGSDLSKLLVSEHQKQMLMSELNTLDFVKKYLGTNLINSFTGSISDQVTTDAFFDVLAQTTTNEYDYVNEQIKKVFPHGIFMNVDLVQDPDFKSKHYARSLMPRNPELRKELFDRLVLKNMSRNLTLLPNMEIDLSMLAENNKIDFAKLLSPTPAKSMVLKPIEYSIKAPTKKSELLPFEQKEIEPQLRKFQKELGIDRTEIQATFGHLLYNSYLYDGTLTDYFNNILQTNRNC